MPCAYDSGGSVLGEQVSFQTCLASCVTQQARPAWVTRGGDSSEQPKGDRATQYWGRNKPYRRFCMPMSSLCAMYTEELPQFQARCTWLECLVSREWLDVAMPAWPAFKLHVQKSTAACTASVLDRTNEPWSVGADTRAWSASFWGSRSNYSDPGCTHEQPQITRCHAAREGPCNA